MQQSIYHFIDGLDEAGTYMPSPFSGDVVEDQETVVAHELAGSTDISLMTQMAIPTPPPECAHTSPQGSSGVSISRSSSYIKGSSLEESPVSSPNSSCADDETQTLNVITSTSPVLAKEEFSRDPKEVEEFIAHEQNVPKNIKLPQSKYNYHLYFPYLLI